MNLSASTIQIEQVICDDVLTSNAGYEHVVNLCDRFGSRFGGTLGEAGARDYIRDALQGYGLASPRVEAFEYTGWQRGDARLDVLDAGGKNIRTVACTALPYCPNGEISASLIDVGTGTPQEFEEATARIPGQIVMASSDSPAALGRWVHRKEKYGRAIAAGAAAFIFMNHYPGGLTVTGSLRTDSAGPIPAVGITKEDGEWLRREINRRGEFLSLNLTTRNTIIPATSWNVLADLGPHRLADAAPTWLVGAHYDGHDISQGALDDATGVGVLLETARVLAPHAEHLRGNIRFVAFGVEELGLIGATRYANRHADELDGLELMLNLDSAGDSGRKGVRTQAWPELGAHLENLCRGHGFDLPNLDRLSLASDHYPFFLQGLPTAWLFRAEASGGRGWGHTQADTVDKVSAKSMQEAALATARLLIRLTTAESPLPFDHRPQSEVRAIMEASGMKTVAKFEDRWPFAD